MTVFQDTTDFSRGEVDPALYSRQDADFYATAVKRMDNFVPDRVGGSFKRPRLKNAYGTLSGSPDEDEALYLFYDTNHDFRELDPQSGENFESHDLLIRVLNLDGLDYMLFVERLSQSSAPDATRGNAVIYTVVKIDENDPSLLDKSLKTSQLFYFTNPGLDFGEEIGFPHDVTAWEGNNRYRVSTPRLTELVRVATAGPAAFITTGRMPVVRVFIAADYSIGIETVQFYEELVGQVTTEQGSATVTGTDTLFVDQLSEGDLVEVEGQLLEVDSIGGQETFTATENYTGLSVTTRAAVQNDEPFGELQYPNQVSFFQNRLILASTADKPTGIWASKSNNPFWILPGAVDADSPIAQEVFLPDVNRFTWMAATNRLYLGAAQAEFAVGDPDSVLTPTTFVVSRIGTTGSHPVDVAPTDTALVHVGKSARRMFAVEFDFSRQSFASNDITFLAPHLFDVGVEDVSYQPATQFDTTNRLYVVQADGTLKSCSYSPRENILGWARTTIDDQRNRQVLCVTSSRERTFVVVGAEEDDFSWAAPDYGNYFLAVLEPQERAEDHTSRMDFEVTYDLTGSVPYWYRGTSVTIVNGDGKNLGVYDMPDVEDSSFDTSEIPEADRVTPYTIGYMYDATMELLPTATSDNRGTKINRKKRLVRVLLDLFQTDQAYTNNLSIIKPLPKPDDGYTGVYEKRFLGWGYRDDMKIEILGRDMGRVRSVTREISA